MRLFFVPSYAEKQPVAGFLYGRACGTDTIYEV